MASNRAGRRNRSRLAPRLDVDAAVAGGGQTVKPPSTRELERMRKAWRRFAERTGQPAHPWLKSKDKPWLKGGKRAS